MNPAQMYFRGLRIALSNWGLVWVCYGGTVILVGLSILSLVPVWLLWVSGTLQGGGLQLWAGVGFLFCLWLSLLLYGWFYLEGGLRGIVIRANRAAPPEEKTSLSLSPDDSFRVFRVGAFWEESKRNGWRVAVIASVYAGIGCLALLPLFVPLLLMQREAEGGAPGQSFFLFLGLFVLLTIPIALLLVALSLHYQTAVTLAIQREVGWREGWREATRQIKSRPLEFFGIFGMQILFGMALAAVVFVIQLPLDVLLMKPGLWMQAIVIRGALMLLQMIPQAILTVAAMGAYAVFCEPLERSPLE